MIDLGLVAAAFVLGFFGSPHCLGMCGGVVTALQTAMSSERVSKPKLTLALHAGRLLGYASIGALFGALSMHVPALTGSSVGTLPWMILAVALVFAGLLLGGWIRATWLEVQGGKLWSKLAPVRAKMLPLNSYPRALFFGVTWGFLPCGLVYAALALALGSAHAGSAALIMLGFGLGTLPMMLGTAAAASRLKHSLTRYGLPKLSALLMILSGVWVGAFAFGLVPLPGHADHAGHMSRASHESHASHAQHANMNHAHEHAAVSSAGSEHAHESASLSGASGAEHSSNHAHHESMVMPPEQGATKNQPSSQTDSDHDHMHMH